MDEKYSNLQGFHLSTNKCEVISISPYNNNFLITSNLNEPQISGFKLIINNPHLNDILFPKYYYMKSFAVMEVTNGVNTYYLKPTNAISKYTYNSNTFNQSPGTTLSQVQSIIPNFNKFTNPIDLSQQIISDHLPYILLKPNAVNVNFNLDNFKSQKQIECDNGINSNSCGNYNVKVVVIPIDGKCDINKNGTIDLGSEFLSAIDTSSFVIDKDSDGDGIFDMQEISGTYTNLNEIST